MLLKVNKFALLAGVAALSIGTAACSDSGESSSASAGSEAAESASAASSSGAAAETASAEQSTMSDSADVEADVAAAGDAARDAAESVSETANAAAGAASAAATNAAQAASDAVTVQVAGLTGTADAGESIFRQCQACHALQEGQNRVGPTLYNVVGRVAGTVEGYNYSAANKDSGVTWDVATLHEYLEDPRGFMPGTKMAFAGIKDPQGRADLIAYLKANSPDAE